MTSAGAPPFTGTPIQPFSLPGLSSCLEEGRLRKDGIPFPCSVFDVQALRLAEWAFAKRMNLVLVPPDPLAPLAPMVAAALHVADMAALHKRTGVYAGSSRRVVVVTRDHRLRGIYRGLGVSGGRGTGTALLRAVVPAGTLGRRGFLHILESSGSVLGGWSTLFVGSVESVRGLKGVDLAVVDLPVDGEEHLADLRVPSIIVARDPANPVLLGLADRVPVYAWSDADVRAAAATVALPTRLARIAAGVNCEVVAVPHQPLCENAALFWQDIGRLLTLASRSPLGAELAREAFGMFYDLVGLALPTQLYEDMAGPLRARLDSIAAAARLTAGEVRDLYLPMVTEELRGLAAAIGSEPRKFQALVRTLEECVDDGEDVMLVARTAPLARLHAEHLRAQPRLRQVRVTSLGALVEEEPADVAVLTGMAPGWARWVYRSGVARTVKVIAYTPEGPVESVAKGFDEVKLVRSAIGYREAMASWLARPAMKARAWAALSGTHLSIADEQPIPPAFDSDKVPVVTTRIPDVPPGLWEAREWLAALEPTVASTPGERSLLGQVEGDTVVEAVRVVFEEGRWTLLDIDGSVTRLKPGSGEADPAFLVSRLRPGDEILFLDGTSRKGLLTKVLEVAEEVPALALASAWVSHWRRVLARAYAKYGTYTALAEALWTHGCTVQHQTIRLWVIGVTIGPDDPRDIVRVGQLMADHALVEQQVEIRRSMRSLRGAHVRLGHRVSDLARHVGAAAVSGKVAMDEVIDERTGLTAADFYDSIDVLTIRSIQNVGRIPFVLTGQLRQPAEED